MLLTTTTLHVYVCTCISSIINQSLTQYRYLYKTLVDYRWYEYVHTYSAVVVNNMTSSWFATTQGVRQGGVLSGFLYILYINDLLNELEMCNPNFGTPHMSTSNPAFADDITCLNNTPRGLQNMMQCCYIYWKEKETHILNFLTSDLYWFLLISAIYTHLYQQLNSSTNFYNLCWWCIQFAMTSLPRICVHWLYAKETRAGKRMTFESNDCLSKFPP